MADDSRFRLAAGGSYEFRQDNSARYGLFNEGNNITDGTKTKTTGYSGTVSAGYLGKHLGARGNYGMTPDIAISGDIRHREYGYLGKAEGAYSGTFYGIDVFFVAERFSTTFLFGLGIERQDITIKSKITGENVLFTSSNLNAKGTAQVLKYFICSDYMITKTLGISFEVGVKSGQIKEFKLTETLDLGRGFAYAEAGSTLSKANGPVNKLSGSVVTMDLSQSYGMVSIVYVF